MEYVEHTFGASAGEVWQKLANGFEEGTVDEQAWNGQQITARVGKWTVTLDSDHASEHEAFVVSTRLRAPFINKDGFRFHISHEGLLTRMGKLLGLKDVQTGDAVFDRAFLVRSDNEAKVRQFLANPSIRSTMVELCRVSLCVKDDEGWFGTDFPAGVDELYLEVPRLVGTPAELRVLFDFFALCLRQLCHIGSAYPDDPGLTLS